MAKTSNMNLLKLVIYLYISIRCIFGSVNKKKLCVEFRLQSSHGNYSLLQQTATREEHACMLNCIKHPICMAYNYWATTGMCELLPPLPPCSETIHQPESIFVHLAVCNAIPSWEVGRFDWDLLGICRGKLWYNDTANWPDDSMLIITDGIHKRVLSASPYKGLYLPRWILKDEPEFRFATEKGDRKKCANSYLFINAGHCEYEWLPFTAGEAVPETAVVGGMWMDGSPLYIIRQDNVERGSGHVGYYSPSTSLASIVAYVVHHPEHMNILIVRS